MARGFIASFLGMFVMACSGCGGGGGSSPAPVAQATAPRPSLSITSIDPTPVMGRGGAGAWDSGDVLNPTVIQRDNALYDYYSGYDGSVWRTGLATSTDSGVTWTKQAKPVLGLGGWATQYIAANGAAISFNGQVLYFFQGEDSNGVTKIGLATSSDGVNFTMQPNPVLNVEAPGSWDDTAVGDPYIVQFGNTLYLYYLGMNSQDVQLLGVATSTDGINWTRVAGPLLPQGGATDFDAHGQGEPAVVYSAPFYYMLYVGRSPTEFRDIGWAVSSDGINWTKQSQGLIPANLRQAWDSQVICDPTILPTGNNDGTFNVWFGGGDKDQPSQGLDGQIGRFTMKLN
jgi:predicted GH43/DUF377 family glycosyl hydrolase